MKVEYPVKVHEATFTGKVDCSGCRFERGIDLSECRFEDRLDFLDARIEGPLIIDKAVINMRAVPGKERIQRPSSYQQKSERLGQELAADFTNLRVAGRLSMAGTRVFGSFACDHADIEDDFCIDEAHIHGDLSLRRVNLGEVRSDGKELPSRDGTTYAKKANDKLCCVDGKFDLTSAVIRMGVDAAR